jgi:hypothetical protein
MDIEKGMRIKFKGRTPMGWPKTKRFSQILEDMKRGKNWQGIKTEIFWEEG